MSGRVEDCPRHWDEQSTVGFCLPSPFQLIRAACYWDLTKYADVHVVVPDATSKGAPRRAELTQGSIAGADSCNCAIGHWRVWLRAYIWQVRQRGHQTQHCSGMHTPGWLLA